MVHFNIGETFYIEDYDEIITLKCVADNPDDSICGQCFFYGHSPWSFLCTTLSCMGRHFEFIDGKEIEK